MAWIDNGPVSLPPRWLAYTVGFLAVALAIGGVGVGFHTAWRNGDRVSVGGGARAADDTAVAARPIVVLPEMEQQAAAANAATATNTAAADDADDNDDETNSLASRSAAAQAVQSHVTMAGANIDDLNTSHTERPQAPAKPSADESAPSDGKSDVPF